MGVSMKLSTWKPPKGVSTDPNDIWVLKKSLYGLKQSGKAWNNKIHDVLTSMGFKCCASDQCVYIYNLDNTYCALMLYVDDILLACDSNTFLKSLKMDLKENFDIAKLGPTSTYLGLKLSVTPSNTPYPFPKPLRIAHNVSKENPLGTSSTHQKRTTVRLQHSLPHVLPKTL